MQVARLEAEKAALAKRSAESAEREAMQAATLQAVNQRLAEDNAALAARVAGLERPAPGNQARARRPCVASALGAARRCGATSVAAGQPRPTSRDRRARAACRWAARLSAPAATAAAWSAWAARCGRWRRAAARTARRRARASGPPRQGRLRGPGRQWSDELVLVMSAVCVREGVCKPPVVHEKHGPAGVWLGGAQLGQHVGPAGGLPAVSAADAGRTGQSRPPDSRLSGQGRGLERSASQARALALRAAEDGAQVRAPLARAGYRVGYTLPVPHWQRSERGLLSSNCHEFVIELHEQARGRGEHVTPCGRAGVRSRTCMRTDEEAALSAGRLCGQSARLGPCVRGRLPHVT